MRKEGFKLELQTLALNEIYPYEHNPRKNENAVDAVAKSIEQCEYIAPIIVDENHVILAGHTRYKALKKLGYREAEIIIKAGLTEEQKKKYRLLDNKTNELAEWDFDILAQELKGLDFEGLDIDWGISLQQEDIQEDDYSIQIPDEPKAKPGQIWQLGEHRLMCGDSTKPKDVECLMNGQLADMLLTDPPYNVDYEGKTRQGLTIQNDHMEDNRFRVFLKDAFSCAVTVMKPGAAFYIWHPDVEGYNFHGACRDVGLQVRQCLVWCKNAFVLGRKDYQCQHELCLYGWKEGASHLWAADRKQTTLLHFERPSHNEQHPTMKPVLLFDYQMKNNTKGGDIVLDLFGGSGTAIIAAEQNGRICYTMECDPRYIDVIIDRWETLTGHKAILLNP